MHIAHGCPILERQGGYLTVELRWDSRRGILLELCLQAARSQTQLPGPSPIPTRKVISRPGPERNWRQVCLRLVTLAADVLRDRRGQLHEDIVRVLAVDQPVAPVRGLAAGRAVIPSCCSRGDRERPAADRPPAPARPVHGASPRARRTSGRKSSVFLYARPAREPAFGPPAFMHREAIRTPEAPISHHWLDSTHISYGVVTRASCSTGSSWRSAYSAGASPTNTAGTSRPGRSIPRRYGCRGTRPRSWRCSSAGGTSIPSSSNPKSNRSAFGERSIRALAPG